MKFSSASIMLACLSYQTAKYPIFRIFVANVKATHEQIKLIVR